MRARRLAGALAAALLAACGSYTVPDSVIYGQAVYTQPRPGFDFASQRTYWLDPTVTVVADDGSSSQALLDWVASDLTTSLGAYGWSPAPVGSADVGLEVMLFTGTSGTYPAGYWCNYSGYTGCLAGWSYAGVYSQGTVILQMGAPPAGGELVWMAALHGAGGGGWNDPARVSEAIGRAFAQSPYLAH